jgi:hypothetical protein
MDLSKILASESRFVNERLVETTAWPLSVVSEAASTSRVPATMTTSKLTMLLQIDLTALVNMAILFAHYDTRNPNRF